VRQCLVFEIGDHLFNNSMVTVLSFDQR